MTRLQRRQRILTALVMVCGVLTAIGVGVLYPYDGPPPPPGADPSAQFGEEERLRGVITAIRPVEGTPAGFLLPGAVELDVDVQLDDGAQLTIPTIDETGIFEVGKAVEVALVSAPGTPELYQIVDFPRDSPLAALALLFAAAVLLLGRWQGLRALVGLILSALIIVGFLVPALLAGRNPTVLAAVAALAVMFVTLPLSHGWTMTTRAAIAGTAVALLATIGLALAAVEMTNLTGLSSEDVQMVRFSTGVAIDVRGLLLAGIIVGTLGVLDDVTVSQASTVAALRRADPRASDRTVFAGALRVGRDHIAATVNTLFLAYAGAALPLLILFSVGGAPVAETLSSELVAQEVVRTLVGSIGLVLAVPLTTAVAVMVTDAASEGGHVHGEVLTTAAADTESRAVLPQTAVEEVEGPPGEPGTSPGPVEPEQPEASDPSDAAHEVGSPAWEDSLRRSYGLSEDD